MMKYFIDTRYFFTSNTVSQYQASSSSRFRLKLICSLLLGFGHSFVIFDKNNPLQTISGKNNIIHRSTNSARWNREQDQADEDVVNFYNDEDFSFLDELFLVQEECSTHVSATSESDAIAGVEATTYSEAETDDDYNVNEEELIDEAENYTLKEKIKFTSDTPSYRLAPASEIAYFYLYKTLGLSEETMWRITYEYGSILGLTVPNLKQKVKYLTDALFDFQDYNSLEKIQILISKQPSVLHLSVKDNLEPKISFLKDAFGLEDDASDHANAKSFLSHIILQYPAILCYSMANLKHKIHFFRNVLHCIQQEEHQDGQMILRQIIYKTPQLMTYGIDSNLIHKYRFFMNELLFSDITIAKILIKYPHIFTYSLENNLRVKIISFFILTLQFEVPHDLEKILLSFPQIFDYNLERHLIPIMRHFTSEESEFEYSINQFRSILLKFPRIMTNSIEKLQANASYLQNQMKFSPDQIKRIVLQSPQILAMNRKSIEEKIDFLQSEFQLISLAEKHSFDSKANGETGEIEPDELQKLITAMPTLLHCSIKSNLEPKVKYLQQHFTKNELNEIIKAQPSLLGYSLKNRIMPRLEVLLSMNNKYKITTVIPLKESNFQSWVEKRATEQNQQSDEPTTMKRKKRKRVTNNKKQSSLENETYMPGKSSMSEKEIGTPDLQERKARIVEWKQRALLPSRSPSNNSQ